MKYTGRSAQWGLFTWRIMASHKKRLENLQKNHYSSPSYKYLTISFILSPAMMFTTSESVIRLQEVTILILQGVRNLGTRLGTIACSDPHHKVITFETHPLHPWMRFFEGLDRGGRGGERRSLSLRSLLKLTHWYSLQTHRKPLFKSPFKWTPP